MSRRQPARKRIAQLPRSFVLPGLASWLLSVGWQACESKAGHGERCILETDCAEGLVCESLYCRTPDQARQVAALMEQLNQELQRAEEIADQVKEQRLLAQSGVEPARQAERPPEPAPDPSPPGPASIGRVRVCRTTGQPPIFAACRDDEQLVGGGCRALDLHATISHSYPVHFGEQSTRGARWACDARSKYTEKTIEAYALCQAIGQP